MLSRSFVHLRCHSHYSLLDGTASIKRIVTRAKQLGMNALALTDRGNMHGALEFYRCCRDEGIKPIIGLDIDVALGSRLEHDNCSSDAGHSLTLLCQNAIGFHNLLKLVSASSCNGYDSTPRIDKTLLSQYREGIVCLSGGVSSELNHVILQQGQMDPDWSDALQVATWFHSFYGDRYFIEVTNSHLETQKQTLAGAVAVAQRMGLPIVATHDCRYVEPEDEQSHEILLRTRRGSLRAVVEQKNWGVRECHMLTPQEMYEKFPGFEDAVARSQEIADSIDVDLEFGQRHFPVLNLPDGMSSDILLRDHCLKGLTRRYAGNRKMMPGGQLSDEVLERLEQELGAISRLGFAGCILVISDFIEHGRRIGIQAAARGNYVGSLVSYSLSLSHVCPIQNGLRFERFLSELHPRTLGIWIDVCQERRGELINYIKETYGEDKLAKLATFDTFAARKTIREVGQALGLPDGELDRIVNLLPEELGITIQQALVESEELQADYKRDATVRELLDIAAKIEGSFRNLRPHGTSLVLGDKPLTEYLPLTKLNKEADYITQWSTTDVESMGLWHFDLCGSEHLTVVGTTIDLIEQSFGTRLSPAELALDDPATFQLLQQGDTDGVFQASSEKFREFLLQLKPDCFRDLIASVALYRPGPIEAGMVQQYLDVKHGRMTVTYIHPTIESILSETNGVLLYQEQVMQILYRFGGIELADAHRCILAIAKRETGVISQNHERFMAGAIEQGLTKSDAQEFWNTILQLARIGFNKSFAAGYASMMFQAAFLKAHFPVEFKTALERVKRSK